MDGDDLPGVGGSDARPLAGDHDDAVAGDLALHADRPGPGRAAIERAVLASKGVTIAVHRAPRSVTLGNGKAF